LGGAVCVKVSVPGQGQDERGDVPPRVSTLQLFFDLVFVFAITQLAGILLHDVTVADGFRFFFQAEDGIRVATVTGVQTCALPISLPDYGRVARQSPGTHTGLTRSSEVALKAVSRLLARWTIRIARRPLHRPASLAAWG